MNKVDANQIAAQLRDKALINCIGELVQHGKHDEARFLVEQLSLTNRDELIAQYKLIPGDDRRIELTDPSRVTQVIKPNDDAQALFALALSHHKNGDHARAVEVYQQILARNPNHIGAWQNLGTLRNEKRDIDGAIDAYRHALTLDPENASLRANFAEILRRMGDLEAAADEVAHAIELNPDNYHARFNGAIIEAERGRFDEAISHYRRAAILNPASPQPHEYLGALQLRLGDNAQAEVHYRNAMLRDPVNAKLHFGLALALLGQGRLSEGWPEWEFRVHCDHFETGLLRSLRGRAWRGENLAGKRILVVTEQGFGDTFMFARYLPGLRQQGAFVILLCQPALIEIMRGCAGIDLLIAKPDREEPDIHYDYYVWMMSLPVRHATTHATVPRSIPYLRADRARVEKWEQLLAAYPGIKIGLVWAGNPHNRLDLHRSVALSKLEPLLTIPNTTFFSLQFGNSSLDPIAPHLRERLVDLSGMLDLDARFVDSAAVMETLDLIITVDTSTCHLAGALGRPVWTLLAKVCDWRWTDTGEQSPWYPTMRLFRQQRANEWEEVIGRVAGALETFVNEKKASMKSVSSVEPIAGIANLNVVSTPNDPIAWCRRGTHLHRAGHLEQAIECYRAALNIDPDHWETRHLLGLAYYQKGDIRRALKHILKALEQYPDYPDAHSNIGLVFESISDYERATEHYLRAIELNPKHLEAHINLGGLKYKQGELHTALHYLNGALRLNQRSSRAHNNIGVIQLALGHVERAIEHFEHALAADPYFADAHNNMGNARKQLGQLDEAVAAYQRAIDNDSSLAVAHWNRALIWLSQGHLDKGWDAYEWGRRCGERHTRQTPYPEWDGASLQGKHILVYGEQGVGDEIFFSRFLTPILQQTLQTYVYCDTRLIPLLSRSFPNLTCLPKTNQAMEESNTLHIDYSCPLGSLPRYLCRSRDQVNSFSSPFLLPDAGRVDLWKQRYRKLSNKLKVGIAWRGGKSADQKSQRSIPLIQWHSLLLASHADFICLQHGDCAEEISQFTRHTGVAINTWPESDPLHNLDDFAAQIAALDLVIAVDNSTVHLACALGQETWILVPIAADFRWQALGNTTPWYPTARLFRQTTFQHWENELNEIAAKLQERTNLTAARACGPTAMNVHPTRSFLDTPILVVGAPRSGTSLLTGILERCGAWLGATVPGDEPNPKGYFENELLRDLNKQVLADLGWDPLGVDPLPQSNPPELSTFRDAVIYRLRLQGYTGQAPWAFKCVKTPLLWRLWHNAFPHAQWIIVRRDPKEVVQSVLRSSFFQSREHDQAWWEKWLSSFNTYLADLASKANFIREISTTGVIHGDLIALQTLIADLRLVWSEANVRSFIDPTLWGRRDYSNQAKRSTLHSFVDRPAPQVIRNTTLAAQIESHAYKVLLAGDLAQSDELCRRWLAADPLSDEAYRLLGSSACQRREWQRAIEYFQNGLSYRPASSQLHYNLGVALYQCGRYTEAVASYRTATAIKSDYIEAWENLAASLAAAGEYRHAAELYRQLVRTAPLRVASQQALSTLERMLVTHP